MPVYVKEMMDLELVPDTNRHRSHTVTCLLRARDSLAIMLEPETSLREIPDSMLLMIHGIGPVAIALVREKYPYRGYGRTTTADTLRDRASAGRGERE